MICDHCAWKDSCLLRTAPGQHLVDCEEYFPDLMHAKPQKTGRYATLEKRLQIKKRGR